MSKANLPKPAGSSHPELLKAAAEFWHIYYSALRRVHEQEGRCLTEPVRDRNLSTTDSKHVAAFEAYCCSSLASALGVASTEVGKRTIRFRPYRSKSFDVCWPLTGEPKILISVKSMQNAYRNFTNRIEEAFGDSAVLRVYKKLACFGFMYFMVDGSVARGLAETAKPPSRLDASGKQKRTKGTNIHLALVEEGGDFFELTEAGRYRQNVVKKNTAKGRKDVILAAQETLLDLLAHQPNATPTIHYDAMAFVPAQIKRVRNKGDAADWSILPSIVDPRLSIDVFFTRLVETARLRGFV